MISCFMLVRSCKHTEVIVIFFVHTRMMRVWALQIMQRHRCSLYVQTFSETFLGSSAFPQDIVVRQTQGFLGYRVTSHQLQN